MTTICIAGPTVPPVSLHAARGALRVDGTDLDALIAIWVKGITADLEQDIGQYVMEQTWQVRLPGFPPCGEIELPHPVLSVESFEYLDAAGAGQEIEVSAYRLNQGRYNSTLTPARGTIWPETGEDAAAVKITIKCGYGTDSSATPPEIELYILAKLAEQFDPATRMERDTVQSSFVAGLLDRCRSRW